MEPTTTQASTPQPTHKKAVGLWITIIAISVVVVGVLIWIGWMFYDQNRIADIKAQQTQEGPTVIVGPNGFDPSVIRIKQGQQVTWQVQDGRTHQLRADATSLPDFTSPETLATGDSYSYSFDASGTYHYYDPANPKLFNGTVTVE